MRKIHHKMKPFWKEVDGLVEYLVYYHAFGSVYERQGLNDRSICINKSKSYFIAFQYDNLLYMILYSLKNPNEFSIEIADTWDKTSYSTLYDFTVPVLLTEEELFSKALTQDIAEYSIELHKEVYNYFMYVHTMLGVGQLKDMDPIAPHIQSVLDSVKDLKKC